MSNGTGLPGTFAGTSHVAWDELDVMGVLHHSRYAVHVERVFSCLLDELGYPFDRDRSVNPDRHHVVAALDSTFVGQVDRPGPIRVTLRVEKLGRSSLVTAFEIADTDGRALATGTRTAVHVEAGTPHPWSDSFRSRLHGLLG